MHRTVMGVAGVSACSVHLDTGVVCVTGSGIDAAAVIAAVTAENYSCSLVLKDTKQHMSSPTLNSSIDFHVGGMTCSSCQSHVHRTVMGVAGVSACSVHLDTGVVCVTGSGIDAAAVIAAVTAENYSCKLASLVDTGGDASALRLLVIQLDAHLDSKGWSFASRVISQLPSVLSCITVPSSSRIEIKGDSCLDGTQITRELRRHGLQSTIVAFSPFSHLFIEIGRLVSDDIRFRIHKLILSCDGVTSVTISDAGHLVVHGAVEPARIMLLLEDEGISTQATHANEQVVVNFDGEDCDEASSFAQRFLAESSTNDDISAYNDGSSLTLVVHGMTCGACVAHVTSALSKVTGKENVSVNLITGSAHIRNWNGDSRHLIAALESSGYGGHEVSAKEPINFTKQSDLQLRRWLRIFYSAAFITVLQSLFTPQSHLSMSMMSEATMTAKSRYDAKHWKCSFMALTNQQLGPYVCCPSVNIVGSALHFFNGKPCNQRSEDSYG